jgi:hypothetical protein
MPTIPANAAPAAKSDAPVIIHLPADLLAALRHEDDNPANWQVVDPDQWKGFSDATADEGGLD